MVLGTSGFRPLAWVEREGMWFGFQFVTVYFEVCGDKRMGTTCRKPESLTYFMFRVKKALKQFDIDMGAIIKKKTSYVKNNVSWENCLKVKIDSL